MQTLVIKDDIKIQAATNLNQQMALRQTPSSGLISHFASSYLKVIPSQSLFYFVPHSQAGTTRYSANSPFLSFRSKIFVSLLKVRITIMVNSWMDEAISDNKCLQGLET